MFQNRVFRKNTFFLNYFCSKDWYWFNRYVYQFQTSCYCTSPEYLNYKQKFPSFFAVKTKAFPEIPYFQRTDTLLINIFYNFQTSSFTASPWGPVVHVYISDKQALSKLFLKTINFSWNVFDRRMHTMLINMCTKFQTSSYCTIHVYITDCWCFKSFFWKHKLFYEILLIEYTVLIEHTVLINIFT